MSSTIISVPLVKRPKHSHKNYIYYLTNENPDSFFLSPTNKKKLKLFSAL